MNYTLGPTLLALKDISLRFGDRLILKDINIEVKDIVREGCVTGQVSSIIGPSGIGKTQLFKIIAGLLKPTTGQVLVGVEQQQVRAGTVGVVAQNYPLFNHRTVISNLGLVSKEKDKIDWYLNELGLTALKSSYPAQLSGGEKQRVAIVQQLLCAKHEILLMDEPYSGLDIKAKLIVSNLISKVANMNEFNTILIISHDLESSLLVSDSAWVIGHDYDEKGEQIEGAHIKYNINLAEMDLCWHPDLSTDPKFVQLCQDIKGLFKQL